METKMKGETTSHGKTSRREELRPSQEGSSQENKTNLVGYAGVRVTERETAQRGSNNTNLLNQTTQQT